MGYYTKLELLVVLNKNAPIEIIKELVSGEMQEKTFIKKFGSVPSMYSVEDHPPFPIEHEFGKSKRWSQIFNPYNSYYKEETRELGINCDIKAYDNIYEHLIDWLKPFIISGIIKTKGEDSEDWYIVLTNLNK